MIPISVIVITKNEEKNICPCLESAAWADEIIVVDSSSKDKTVEFARRYTPKVYEKEWLGYAEAKNFALQHTTHDWVFWLDADERVTPELRREIISLVPQIPDSIDAYKVPRRAFFIGKWITHSGWYPGYVLRLFRRTNASFSNSAVHESLIISGAAGKLHHDLLHYTDPNVFHYLKKFNKYTTLAVKDSAKGKQDISMGSMIAHSVWKFFQMYVFRLGFLDGTHGFILAVLSSNYVFTKYAKLWESRRYLPVMNNREYISRQDQQ